MRSSTIRNFSAVAAAGLTVALVGTTTAYAAPNPTPVHKDVIGSTTPFTLKLTKGTAAPKIPASPALTEWCIGTATAPVALIVGSRTYVGKSQVTSCSNPPLAECHLVASFEEWVFNGLNYYWGVVSTVDKGWSTNCKQSAEPSHYCTNIVGKHQFRTESALTGVATWGASYTDIEYSGTTVAYCS